MIRRSRQGLKLVGVIAGFVVFLLLVVLIVQRQTRRHGDAVAVIGDSITSKDSDALNDSLGGDFKLFLSGEPGSSVEQSIPRVDFMLGRTYDQVIFNLGSNDVIRDLDLDTAVATLESLIERFKGAECIHVVTINEHMYNLTTKEMKTDNGVAINEKLEKLADRNDRVSLIDWRAEINKTLNDEQLPYSKLTADSIHPTDEGNNRLNSLYRDALEGCGSWL